MEQACSASQDDGPRESSSSDDQLAALLEDGPSSDAASDKGASDDAAHADILLERILAEDGNDDAVLTADREVLSAERRAELDLLLQQADMLARPSGDSRSSSRPGSLSCSDAGALEAALANVRQEDDLRRSCHPSPSSAVGGAANSAAMPGGPTEPPNALHAPLGMPAPLEPPSERLGRRWLGGGGLLHIASLDGMAAQVGGGAGAHLDRGQPTAIALHPLYVAVGTSRGHVAIFDRRQSLQAVLTSAPARAVSSGMQSLSSSFLGRAALGGVGSGGGGSGGSTSAPTDSVACLRLSDSPTSPQLLVGHASGRLVLWDLATSAVLKECTDLHDASVLHLRFLHPSKPNCLTVGACRAAPTPRLVPPAPMRAPRPSSASTARALGVASLTLASLGCCCIGRFQGLCTSRHLLAAAHGLHGQQPLPSRRRRGRRDGSRAALRVQRR